MFLLGLEVVLFSYTGVRVYEKVYGKNIKFSSLEKNTSTELVEVDDSRLPTSGDARKKNLHFMKTSALSIGMAHLTFYNPVFFVPMLAAFTYSAVPYLRIIENSLLKNKKIDGYVLYGIADFMTFGLGKVATASFALGLVHTAHYIISNAEQNSKDSLVNIFAKQPSKVWLLKDGSEIETALADVKIGDTVLVNTGDLVPVDGVVVDGVASIDQHMLTGESQPAEKAVGERVFAATQVMTGSLQIQVSHSGDQTTVAKITEMLNHSVDFKSHAQLKGEKWADSWNLPVLGLAFASMPVLGPVGTIVILNGHIAQNIRIVAPLSTMNFLNVSAHKGILVKDGRVLEDLPNIDTFLFDKTGTLTSEQPNVGKIHVYLDGYDENDILAYAAAAEAKLKHPIARAILEAADEAGLEVPEPDDSSYQIGYGVSVKFDNKLIQVGSHRFMHKESIPFPEDFAEVTQDAQDSGHSLILLAIDGKLAGVLEMHATVRPEVPGVLADLRKSGVKHFAIVSGDHRQPTEKLAKTLGIDDCFYDVLPQNKAEIVKQLQDEGRSVCFVGDGVNDTLAMKTANISVSLSGATSVATDTAQIVLMSGSLTHLPELLKTAHELDKNLNKGWLYNIVPGTMTIVSAFLFHITIPTAILLSQGGLGLGVINAMLPLKEISQKEKLALKNSTES